MPVISDINIIIYLIPTVPIEPYTACAWLPKKGAGNSPRHIKRLNTKKNLCLTV